MIMELSTLTVPIQTYTSQGKVLRLYPLTSSFYQARQPKRRDSPKRCRALRHPRLAHLGRIRIPR